MAASAASNSTPPAAPDSMAHPSVHLCRTCRISNRSRESLNVLPRCAIRRSLTENLARSPCAGAVGGERRRAARQRQSGRAALARHLQRALLVSVTSFVFVGPLHRRRRRLLWRASLHTLLPRVMELRPCRSSDRAGCRHPLRLPLCRILPRCLSANRNAPSRRGMRRS